MICYIYMADARKVLMQLLRLIGLKRKIKKMLTWSSGCVSINEFIAERQRTHLENNIVQIFCKCTIHSSYWVSMLYGFNVQFSNTKNNNFEQEIARKTKKRKAFLTRDCQLAWQSPSNRFYLVWRSCIYCAGFFVQYKARDWERSGAYLSMWASDQRSSNAVMAEKDK